MSEKLIPLTIERSRWARGGKNGESALLNDDGNMCCLGFACKVLGFKDSTVKNHGVPSDLVNSAGSGSAQRHRGLRAGKLVESGSADEGWYDTAPVDKALTINDDNTISDKMREYRLTPILRKLGFKVRFVG
jgi:hypothetical protein